MKQIYGNGNCFLFAARIMAQEEVWIIADNDSTDKMVKFHQLKNLVSLDLALAQWYLFANFDTYTQTASATGNAFQQLERGLLNAMRERDGTPHSILFILGDSFLEDEKLLYNPQNLYTVLLAMCKQLRNQVRNYTEILPTKTQPLQEIKLFVTKPLPRPEQFFKNRQHVYQQASKARHLYNNKLVAALHALNMNFINPGIQGSNA